WTASIVVFNCQKTIPNWMMPKISIIKSEKTIAASTAAAPSFQPRLGLCCPIVISASFDAGRRLRAQRRRKEQRRWRKTWKVHYGEHRRKALRRRDPDIFHSASVAADIA